MAGLPMKRAIGCVDRSPPYFVLVPCGAPTPHWGFGYDGSARLTSVSLVWSVLCTQGPDESVFFVSCVPETLFVCFFSFFKPAKTRARPGISILLHPPPNLSLFSEDLVCCFAGARTSLSIFHLSQVLTSTTFSGKWVGEGTRGRGWRRGRGARIHRDPAGILQCNTTTGVCRVLGHDPVGYHVPHLSAAVCCLDPKFWFPTFTSKRKQSCL